MKQYLSIKAQHEDAILLFRMGDFYETFYEDARVAARELNIVLTARDKGVDGEKVPLAGIPHHALDAYLARLIERGHRVAICEQMEDPSKAKGLVERAVVRVITPGTVVEESLLSGSASNYLASVAISGGRVGIAALDTSTGEFMATEMEGEGAVEEAAAEIVRLSPAEVLIPRGEPAPEALTSAAGDAGAVMTPWDPLAYEEDVARDRLLRHFGVASLDGFGCAGRSALIAAAGSALDYAGRMQGGTLSHVSSLRVYSDADHMVLDPVTLRDLEVFENVRDGGRQDTLFEVLDLARTSMGSRRLAHWLREPLLDVERINARLDAVDELRRDVLARKEARGLLSDIADLERLVGRVVGARASPRDLIALRDSIVRSGELGTRLAPSSPLLAAAIAGMADLEDVASLIGGAIVDDPPAHARDGNVFREGHSPELDGLRAVLRDGGAWMASFEARERARTGIRSLRIGHNKVFGYYIEVSRANLERAPEDYERKQTLANAERFITPELKEVEARVLGARGRIESLEQELFDRLREDVATRAADIKAMAEGVATVDALAALAERADLGNYARPIVDGGDQIVIIGGRHPVVEAHLEAPFVPNDTRLDGGDYRLMLITGPNMAGKSTYMRQVALVTLMAQAGSFVPAEHATVGTVDRIFTRVGAFDDLVHGQSTFMVEMLELANILHSATGRSLVLLDEIGRGTSTFDGMSIAWAVAEHMADPKRSGAKTLFATHYHELTALEERLKGVRNLNVAVSDEGHGLVFLRKVVPGPSLRSYGIQVARLAGLPPSVIERSNEILAVLEGRQTPDVPRPRKRVTQHVLFHESEAERALREMDVENMTPVEALNALAELRKRVGR
ncbi:MAG: DNA mismatch repair protein MutS [Thermoplasmata archaeon]|nr:DNA mismatch repair protein MutS [Thermoplasmata archaeon]